MTQAHPILKPGIAAALTLLSTLALAQTPPDAGSLLQQNQPRKPAPPPRPDEQPSSLRPPAARLALPAGAQVEVKRFELSGNTLIGEAELQARLAPYTGRKLGLQELQRAASVVGSAYEKIGRLARVLLPPQDVTEGVIRLQIVEARLGEVRVAGDATRFTPAQAKARILAGQAADAPLNLVALDRALLLLDDLPGVAANGSLEPGQAEGLSDLAVRMVDTPALTGDASLDNGGGRSTGVWRASADLNLNSALGLGDLLQLGLNASEGSQYARLAGSLPLGPEGWRVGLNASALRYHLIGDEFSALQSRGTSRTVGLEASYPLIRSQANNLSLQLSADRKHFDNEAQGSTSSRYSSSTVTAGFNGSRVDESGASSASLAFSSGSLDLAGSPSFGADQLSTRTDGHFSKLRYFLARQQNLSAVFSAAATLSGQASSDNLDSSEKFYLGGPQGVRAYPGNEAGGSSGQLLSLELRATLPRQFFVSGFFDWGHIRVNERNDFVGAPQPNSYSLKGAGMSLSWRGPRDLSVQATLARRIGSNPSPLANGRDQDGSLTRNRVWLQVSLPF